MGSRVLPQTFLIGYSCIDYFSMFEYLKTTHNEEFIKHIEEAKQNNLTDADIICSFYAKLCYKSLSRGNNNNITKVRDIKSNVEATFDAGHGSVFEHFNLNFVTTNCSRIFTHELVRHRVGTAFSQTSGRYVRSDEIDFVYDPELDCFEEMIEEYLVTVENLVYAMECKKGLRKPPEQFPDVSFDCCLNTSDLFNYIYGHISEGKNDVVDFEKLSLLDIDEIKGKLRWVPSDSVPFSVKKKITSAIRRIIPNGQANEIGFSLNIRSLRHIVQLRTSEHAEWEIRYIFNQVYDIINKKFPMIFYGAKVKEMDGLKVIYDMKTQP